MLREAGILDSAADGVFTGADHGVERSVEQDYQRSLTVADCLREDVLLAYQMNDALLPSQHRFPLRLLVPGWYGMAHVKWPTGITVVAEPFDGFSAGRYRLAARAQDASGRSQPVDARWNRGGFANNMIQRVPILVIE